MFYKKGWQTIIVELKPTKENLLLLKQGLKVKYDGTMTRLYQSDIPNVGLQSRSAQTTCTTIFVEYWHCTGTGQCSTGTCDQCNLCVGYESYSMCGSGPVGPGPLYIDAGGSTGGGSGGGSSTQTNDEAIAIIPNLDQLNPYVDGYIEFNLDIDASSKSPFNIDRSGITDATPEGIKFNTVYDALLESPKFQELFENLFGNSDRFNVIFQIGSVANGARGNTNTDLFNPTLNTITISPDFIKNNSKLVVAKTILHECIHAYLNVKLCDGGQGMSIPNINNQDFYNIVNQKYNYFAPGENQHNFIYNFMLPTMQTILLDVKDTLVSPTDNA